MPQGYKDSIATWLNLQAPTATAGQWKVTA
jgi:hypothetical protein